MSLTHFDAQGQALTPGGAALASLASLDLTGLHPRLAAVEVVIGGLSSEAVRVPRLRGSTGSISRCLCNRASIATSLPAMRTTISLESDCSHGVM